MSAYHLGAFELNDSACMGKGLNGSCYNVCLMFNCQVEASELNDSAFWGKVLYLLLPCLLDAYLPGGSI